MKSKFRGFFVSIERNAYSCVRSFRGQQHVFRFRSLQKKKIVILNDCDSHQNEQMKRIKKNE